VNVAKMTQLSAFSRLLDIPGEEGSGILIAENAHRCGSPIYTYREML